MIAKNININDLIGMLLKIKKIQKVNLVDIEIVLNDIEDDDQEDTKLVVYPVREVIGNDLEIERPDSEFKNPDISIDGNEIFDKFNEL